MADSYWIALGMNYILLTILVFSARHFQRHLPHGYHLPRPHPIISVYFFDSFHGIVSKSLHYWKALVVFLSLFFSLEKDPISLSLSPSPYHQNLNVLASICDRLSTQTKNPPRINIYIKTGLYPKGENKIGLNPVLVRSAPWPYPVLSADQTGLRPDKGRM